MAVLLHDLAETVHWRLRDGELAPQPTARNPNLAAKAQAILAALFQLARDANLEYRPISGARSEPTT